MDCQKIHAVIRKHGGIKRLLIVKDKKAVLSQRLPRDSPYLSIRQYARGLLLEFCTI